MSLTNTWLALPLVALSCAGTGTPDAAAPVRSTTTAAGRAALASFGRFVGGEWSVTFTSGATATHAWRWGPRRLSLRRMARASDAETNAWAGEVLYWHPRSAQTRLLSVHADIPGIGRGVAEGTIRFDGETAVADIALDQPRGRRTLGQTQQFDGRDHYHEILREDAGFGFQPLAAWDFTRGTERRDAEPAPAERAPVEIQGPLRVFAPFAGAAWESTPDSARADSPPLRSTIAWEASLDAIVARVVVPAPDGESTPKLDVYVYRAITGDALRCLVLSEDGTVSTGVVSVVDDGGLNVELEADDGEHVTAYVARLDVDEKGRLHTRAWSRAGGERTLVLELVQARVGQPHAGR